MPAQVLSYPHHPLRNVRLDTLMRLRWLAVLMFIANLGGMGVQTLVLYVLREENGLSEITIGIALSIAGAVTILSSFIAPRVARGRPLGHSILGSVTVASYTAVA